MHNAKTSRRFIELRTLLAWLVLLTLLVASWGASADNNGSGPSNGASVNRADNGRNKIAADLDKVLTGRGSGREKWIKNAPGGQQVSVVILGKGKHDPELKELRRAIVAAGGSVNRKFLSIVGLAAVVPAARVKEIAQRTDVWRVTPNRVVVRAGSMLETVTGADAVRTLGASAALDGTGVGIAFLDSGIMATHGSMLGGDGTSRVKRSVDFTAPSATLDSPVDASGSTFQDPYGHGTLVASMAAGRSVPGTLDTTGIAPGASLYDVRVLDDSGYGDLARTIAGIDWVVAHAAEYGIRVLNISLGTDSTDSYLTDPLCGAVRTAVAAGITVVVAAGNYGADANGGERYGTISSPGDEPAAITVGSTNPRGTAARDNDTVSSFSGRGPTRGSYLDANGTRQFDDVLKPDLVGPGSRVIGAVSTDRLGVARSVLALAFPQLVIHPMAAGNGLMTASGTSFATPVVAGTAALLLQANPGLTPPLIKAILQYTAEPLAGHNLLQQGAGLVNVPGALAIAGALSTDLSARVAAGTIAVGGSMLAPGQSLPPSFSIIGWRVANWSRFVSFGGRYVLTGSDLFSEYQGAYDPRLIWVGSRVSFTDTNLPAPSGALVSAGVISLTAALGPSSFRAGTGVFTPSAYIGSVPGAGIVMPNGLVVAEGVLDGGGIDLGDGIVVAEGLVVAEEVDIADGVVVAESGPMPGE